MRKSIKPSLSASVLEEASSIVNGDRQVAHGAKERCFANIAEYWTTFLHQEGALPLTESITPPQVSMMMVLLKIARASTGLPKRDHFVDMAGYTALTAELLGVEN